MAGRKEGAEMKNQMDDMAKKVVEIADDLIKDFNPDKALAVLKMAEILIEAKCFPKIL